MSSPTQDPNNPFKSRLFNFINRQVIQIGDRLGTTFRHVKVATEWGLQVILYPLYLIVQASRSVGKQIGLRLEKSSLLPASVDSASTEEKELPNLTVDRPIQGVLKAISELTGNREQGVGAIPCGCHLSREQEEDNSKIVDGNSTPIEIIHLPKQKLQIDRASVSNVPINIEKIIQGIAIQLDSRNLVLINANNQILDVLDRQQQQKLKQRIVWEVASYYHDRRLLSSSREGLLPVNPSNSNVLAPVRFFWQTMDWVQTSPVAMAIDLFGESKLFVPSFDLSSLDRDRSNESNELLVPAKAWLVQIDSTIAQLETDRLSSTTELVDRLGENWSGTLQTLTNKLKNSKQNSTNTTELTRSDPFQIQALIRAAIDYFFGKQGDNIQVEGKVIDERMLSDRQQPILGERIPSTLPGTKEIEFDRWDDREDDREDDPWLSWEDLYEDSSSTTELQSNMLSSDRHLQLPSAPQTPNLSPQLAPDLMKKSLAKQRQKALRRRQAQPNSLIKRQPKSNRIAQSPANADRLSRSQSQSSNLSNDRERDWWEVESTPIGYEKHPLERILKLLDRLILFVEEVIVFIWRKIRG
jgi:hypothetical protein